MDYASLIGDKTVTGSLADRCNYAKLPAAELIKNAQDEIFARLRVREMRKSLTIVLAQGGYTAPIPADFLDTDVLFDIYTCEIKRINEQRLLARRCFDVNGNLIQSLPSRYAMMDDLFQFDYAANGPMTLTGMYYGALYLGPTVNTNFLTNRYSNLFWNVLLKWTYGYRKEWQAAQGHGQAAESDFQTIEQNDDLAYRGLDDDDAGNRL